MGLIDQCVLDLLGPWGNKIDNVNFPQNRVRIVNKRLNFACFERFVVDMSSSCISEILDSSSLPSVFLKHVIYNTHSLLYRLQHLYTVELFCPLSSWAYSGTILFQNQCLLQRSIISSIGTPFVSGRNT